MTEQVNIAQQMEYLQKLQDIDAQIYKLNAEKESKPEEIKEIEDSLSQKQSGMKEAEENLKNLQVKHKEKEMELGSKEEGVKKLQSQLYQLKTNKEYSAMLHEIEGHKADNSLLEEEIIGLMDSIDTASANVAEERKKFEEESGKASTSIKVIEDRIKEIENNISELKNRRQELVPNIAARTLKDYERILSVKNGLALVEVVNDCCGGCHIQMPPQVINQIKMKQNIIRCENCNRMLYIKDEQA